MPILIRLPNGSYIDANCVESLTVETHTAMGRENSMVIIRTPSKINYEVHAESRQKAQDICDKLAAEIMEKCQ